MLLFSQCPQDMCQVITFPYALAFAVHMYNKTGSQINYLFSLYCLECSIYFEGHLFLGQTVRSCLLHTCGGGLREWSSVMRNAYQSPAACPLAAISCHPGTATGRPSVHTDCKHPC